MQEAILKATIQMLENENIRLRDEIKELRRLIVPVYNFPTEWELPRRQNQVLSLLAHHNGKVTIDRLKYVYDVHDVDTNSFESHISKLRKQIKLLNLPITIHARRFEGYWLDNHGKVYLEQFIEGYE
jgi:DNA-binding response OmpR family regulator